VTCGPPLAVLARLSRLFRWLPEADLPAFYAELASFGLGADGADTITDIVSCPGTDTCKLGISSSRGLATELRKQLSVISETLAPAAKDLLIKCSGCSNSCGQHHVADMGFLGVSRNVNGRRVPHFQLVVGGQYRSNAASYGLAIGAVPSKRVPEIVKRLTDRYIGEKLDGETFQSFIGRIGKKEVRKLVDEMNVIPPYEQDPSFYSDWGDPREYTIGDLGVGECAGEVVPIVQVELAGSEREVFEAQVLLDEANYPGAAERAYSSMVQAAYALAREKNDQLSRDPEEVLREFRKYYYDTKLFFDPFSGGKFAHYYFAAHEDRKAAGASKEGAHQLIEEAQLFVEAAHQCYTRIGSALP